MQSSTKLLNIIAERHSGYKVKFAPKSISQYLHVNTSGYKIMDDVRRDHIDFKLLVSLIEKGHQKEVYNYLLTKNLSRKITACERKKISGLISQANSWKKQQDESAKPQLTPKPYKPSQQLKRPKEFYKNIRKACLFFNEKGIVIELNKEILNRMRAHDISFEQAFNEFRSTGPVNLNTRLNDLLKKVIQNHSDNIKKGHAKPPVNITLNANELATKNAKCQQEALIAKKRAAKISKQAVCSLPLIIFSKISINLQEKMGNKKIMILGYLFMLLSIILYILLNKSSSDIHLIIATFCFGITWVCIWNSAITNALSTLPQENAALASGTFATLQELGGNIGLSVSVTITLGFSGFIYGFHYTMLWMLVPCIIGLVSALFINEKCF